MSKLSLTLLIWRQSDSNESGAFDKFIVSADQNDGLFAVLDRLNEMLDTKGRRRVAYLAHCEEGVCGECGFMVNGKVSTPDARTTCMAKVKHYLDSSQVLKLEPYHGYPVLCDLIVDRSSLYDAVFGTTMGTFGNVPGINDERIMPNIIATVYAAQRCLQCGRCLAACPNNAGMLCVSARHATIALMPQGKAQRGKHAIDSIEALQEQGIADCSNARVCTTVCPANMSHDHVQRLRRDYLTASLKQLVSDD